YMFMLWLDCDARLIMQNKGCIYIYSESIVIASHVYSSNFLVVQYLRACSFFQTVVHLI
ncbi:hypothetical protein ACJX0J_016964, partial [Zea mays]